MYRRFFKPLPQSNTRQKRRSDSPKIKKKTALVDLSLSLSIAEELENLQTLDSGFSIRFNELYVLIVNLHFDPTFGSIPNCFVVSMIRQKIGTSSLWTKSPLLERFGRIGWWDFVGEFETLDSSVWMIRFMVCSWLDWMPSRHFLGRIDGFGYCSMGFVLRAWLGELEEEKGEPWRIWFVRWAL